MAEDPVTRACPRCGLEITIWPLGKGRWSSTFTGEERCLEYQARVKDEGKPMGWRCPEIEKIRSEVVKEHDATASLHLSPCRALASQGDGG